MGSKRSNSSTVQRTTNNDNRQIVSTDSHNDSHAISTTTNISGADAAQINAQNAELLRGLGAQQSDATKAVAQMLTQGYEHIGGAFTDVSTVASNNAEKSWTHTIDTSADLLGRVVDATNKSGDTSRLVAQAAIASFQPSENKMGDTFKYAAIAGAAVLALVVLKKA